MAHYGADLPDIEALAQWDPPRATRVWSADEWLLAHLADERRTPVAAERIPLTVARAVVASEDERFFQHRGVDPAAILRAALANYRAGKVVQGGSTLTQQLAKSLLGPQRTWERKIRELLLSRRIEERFTKREILWLYLNQVYFGRGAWGIDEAARAYFGRGIERVSLSEAAFLAGLPQRPSILAHAPRDAEARRRRVLRRMEAAGWLTTAEREAAEADSPRFRPTSDPFPNRAPFAAEAVRRQLVRSFGHKRVQTGGLRVLTTVNLGETRAGRAAVERVSESLDRRQGHRGPLARSLLPGTPARARFLERWTKAYGPAPPAPGAAVEAIIEGVEATSASALIGSAKASLTLAAGRWMKPWDKAAEDNEGEIHDLTAALAPGDVVLVRVLPGAPGGELGVAPVPPPGVQGSLVAIDPHTGAIRSYLAGRDADASEYDRIAQACRQPGSVFKPIVYSEALAQGYTTASLLTDAPYRGEYQGGGLYYRPGNFDREFRGQITLARALSSSRNTASIELLRKVGMDKAIARARRLGIESPLDPVEGLVLGGSCVKPLEVARAFSSFAAAGRVAAPHLLRKVTTPNGEVLLDRTHPGDPDLGAVAALRRATALASAPPAGPGALDPRHAWMMSYLLRDVVRSGTATKARDWEWPAAGKTGTSDRHDAWFAGFTARMLAVAWVGPDRNDRALGKDETGARVALPAWLELMTAAHAGYEPVNPWESPPEGIHLAAVDPHTGLRAARGGRSIRLPFIDGTAPRTLSDPTSSFGRGALGREGMGF